MNKTISQSELKKLLSYNPVTGDFHWVIDKGGIKAGSKAGCVTKSHRVRYVVIKIDQKLYLAHRLAWLYEYGDWPKELLDHIDGNGLNNRICNLRAVSNEQNIQATLKRPKHNTSGFKGVSRYGSKWRAGISINNRRVEIGVFEKPEDAHAAYLKKKAEVHFS